MGGINGLGPTSHKERPCVPNPVFNLKVAAWKKETGALENQAVFFKALETVAKPTQDTRALIAAAHGEDTTIKNDKNAVWLRRMAEWMFGRRRRITV